MGFFRRKKNSPQGVKLSAEYYKKPSKIVSFFKRLLFWRRDADLKEAFKRNKK